MNPDITNLITNGEEYNKLDFIKNNYQEPYLIKNYSQNWKAQKEWNFNLFKFGSEINSKYCSGKCCAWRKTNCTNETQDLYR